MGGSRQPALTLLAKPDRAGSLPWGTVIGAGHDHCGGVRDCPFGTGQDRYEWRGGGTAPRPPRLLRALVSVRRLIPGGRSRTDPPGRPRRLLAWERHAATVGGCARPVRLHGSAVTIDARTGRCWTRASQARRRTGRSTRRAAPAGPRCVRPAPRPIAPTRPCCCARAWPASTPPASQIPWQRTQSISSRATPLGHWNEAVRLP